MHIKECEQQDNKVVVRLFSVIEKEGIFQVLKLATQL